MLHRCLVVIAIATSGCGGMAGLAGDHGGSPDDPDLAVPPSVATVVATPGEHMRFGVKLHGLDVAELTIVVGAPTDQVGPPTIPIQARVVSSPLLTMFHPVDDTLTSWIDPATGRAVAFRAHELASSRSAEVEDTEVRYAAGSFPVKVVRAGQHLEEDQVVRHDTYDVPSMLTFIRGWDGAIGDRVVVDVMRSRTAWRVGVAIAGADTLTTVLGDLAAVRFQGSGIRMKRDGADDLASERRTFSLWVSDDADRVPLRLIARTDYGDVEMNLAEYEVH